MQITGQGIGPCANVPAILYYFVQGITFIRIAIPIVLIIWAIVKLVLVHKSNDKELIQANKKPTIIKFVTALLVFIIPWLASIAIGFASDETKPDWKTCWKAAWSYNTEPVEFKPVIYIYPEEETNITITIPNSDKLLVSYPKYIDGWDVKAYPDGTLIDNKTGRELYSLYYESNYDIKPDMNVGFVVKGEDTIPFLEEKLNIIGLNDKETEEFIIYWLPILQNNKYNYIYFASTEELNKTMPIEFSKEPDTLIRTLMMYKPLDKEITVKEQELTKVTRSGYTVVEWGGSLIK
ncbi:MAG: hypothetical protein IKZ96_02760 [Bacilli bacterium]|nr:hypothetical protein [Bacilli bacterium]